jgi:hypothetical protein
LTQIKLTKLVKNRQTASYDPAVAYVDAAVLLMGLVCYSKAVDVHLFFVCVNVITCIQPTKSLSTQAHQYVNAGAHKCTLNQCTPNIIRGTLKLQFEAEIRE